MTMKPAKICLAVLVALIVLVGVASLFAAYPIDSVCKVTTEVGGSATLVAQSGDTGLVLCCRHVAISEGANVTFKWANGQTTKGFVLDIMPNSEDEWVKTDLSLMLCKMPKGIKPVKVGHFDPKGGPWYAVGYVDGVRDITAVDKVVAVDGSMLVFNHRFIPGHSGGALFDRHGTLVAVTVGYSKKRDLGFAVDGENLQKILEKYSK